MNLTNIALGVHEPKCLLELALQIYLKRVQIYKMFLLLAIYSDR